MSIESIADAAAGAFPPMCNTKRKAEDAADGEPELKKFVKEEAGLSTDNATAPSTTSITMMSETPNTPEVKKMDPPEPQASPVVNTSNKAREVRLEQNRKAARESRRRKKVMIEELQRSVIFFSRANSTLKNQNEDLSRMLVQAQAKVKSTQQEEPELKQAEEAPTVAAEAPPVVVAAPVAPASVPVADAPAATETKPEELSQQEQQAQAQAVATQALFETQGFPAAAARAAAQTMNASTGAHPAPSSLPQMQPGATMQAMANFQQAAAAAMQAAIAGMQSIPNINLTPMAAMPQASAQQAYTDQMTALAMQQAAAAHMGHHMMSALPGTFMAPPFYAWPPAAASQAAAAATAPVMFQQQQPVESTPVPTPAAEAPGPAETTKEEEESATTEKATS